MSKYETNIHVRAALHEDNPLIEREIESHIAIAYEQRTANLIALLTAGLSTVQVAGVDYSQVADQIKERLGL